MKWHGAGKGNCRAHCKANCYWLLKMLAQRSTNDYGRKSWSKKSKTTPVINNLAQFFKQRRRRFRAILQAGICRGGVFCSTLRVFFDLEVVFSVNAWQISIQRWCFLSVEEIFSFRGGIFSQMQRFSCLEVVFSVSGRGGIFSDTQHG